MKIIPNIVEMSDRKLENADFSPAEVVRIQPESVVLQLLHNFRWLNETNFRLEITPTTVMLSTNHRQELHC
jgi:hypothetical protein